MELTDEEIDRLEGYKEEIIGSCELVIDWYDIEDTGDYYWEDCLGKVTILFEPVEDKPGYYWFDKRNYQIISKEVLERVIKEYEVSHKLFLPDP